MKKTYNNTPNLLHGPLLDTVTARYTDSTNFKAHPFTLAIIKTLKTITFPSAVTFFIGENGTGKSTILEAIAHHAGFGYEGGSKNISFKTSEEKHYSGAEQFADQLTLSWRKKPKDGYFFRAETFIYSCDSEQLKKVHYQDTEHYQVTKNFLDYPELYLKHLLEDS